MMQQELSQAAMAGSRAPLDVRVIQGWQGKASSGMWTTVRWGVVAFLVVSMVGTLIDQQSQGGGAGGRLGANSSVHVAEASEKRFSDVMGCNEAKHELEEVSLYPRVFDSLLARTRILFCCRVLIINLSLL
jgi:ATP-dependent Zn protease